jgi:ubiquinone/menaquinone biosynthesis C-methylase UbiE
MGEGAFKTEVRRHFDERAARYDHDTETCDQQDFANFDFVIPYLIRNSGHRVLEVGTGTGIVLDMLLKAGKDAYGLDLSTGLLRVAEEKRHIPRDHLFCGDAEKLCFLDESFDSVCVFRSLHHMENADLVMREMIRCARRDVFVYDGAGKWRRLVKRALDKVGLYQPLYLLLRGQTDTGYRPASETEGPVKVFYAEDAVPLLRSGGLHIKKKMNLRGSILIHAEKRSRSLTAGDTFATDLATRRVLI